MAFYGEPQWSTVGDTYPVGCEFAPSIVFRNSTFQGNPDNDNKKFKYVIEQFMVYNVYVLFLNILLQYSYIIMKNFNECLKCLNLNKHQIAKIKYSICVP